MDLNRNFIFNTPAGPLASGVIPFAGLSPAGGWAAAADPRWPLAARQQAAGGKRALWRTGREPHHGGLRAGSAT
ncbi:hypothetical protein BBAD15_g3060 [Beauveria bassiana D1-5]|uniref:Uncharacterized protein n=1 Tax=Beauveria bassiana D1-5 TaxID=1245745 RepID=A0A0A2VYJ9_BEABA|nr:hypothetical protein BBAD15_g3060 [Beauveria bassiana D1-5]